MSSDTACESVSRTTSMEAGRSFGSFASIDATRLSRSVPASSGRASESSGGMAVACFTASSSMEPAPKGFAPETISARITPRA